MQKTELNSKKSSSRTQSPGQTNQIKYSSILWLSLDSLLFPLSLTLFGTFTKFWYRVSIPCCLHPINTWLRSQWPTHSVPNFFYTTGTVNGRTVRFPVSSETSKSLSWLGYSPLLDMIVNLRSTPCDFVIVDSRDPPGGFCRRYRRHPNVGGFHNKNKIGLDTFYLPSKASTHK